MVGLLRTRFPAASRPRTEPLRCGPPQGPYDCDGPCLLRGRGRWEGHLRALCQQSRAEVSLTGRGGAGRARCASRRGEELFAACSQSPCSRLCLSNPAASSCTGRSSPSAQVPCRVFPASLCTPAPRIQSCKPRAPVLGSFHNSTGARARALIKRWPTFAVLE